MTTLTRAVPPLTGPTLSMPAPETPAQTHYRYEAGAILPQAEPGRDERERCSDERLILAICGGEEWALELLYERYSRYVYTLANRIVHDNVIAEDIAQEAFVTIWSKAESYRSRQGSVRRWIQAIAYHRAIDRVRAAAHRDYHWQPLQVENERVSSAQADLWEEAWRRECRALVRSVLAQLPLEQRQVIELGYFGGYTHAEISEHWHIPLGTVKGRMRLGLQKMKRLLGERGLDSAW